MAERRMIARSVLCSDDYLLLSHEAQALYPQLCLNADDDGFLNSGLRVTRTLGLNESVLQELIATGFLIQFDSNVLAITDWPIQNKVQKDRYHPTRFRAEFDQLEQGEDKRYYRKTYNITDVSNLDTSCIQSIGKDRLVENSIGKKSGEEENGGEYGEEETPFTIPPPTLTDQTMKAEAIRKLREHKSQG